MPTRCVIDLTFIKCSHQTFQLFTAVTTRVNVAAKVVMSVGNHKKKPQPQVVQN